MSKTLGGLVIAILLAFAAIMFFTLGSRADNGVAPARTVVAPGDTLWSIAIEARPNDDPRRTIDRIMALNKMADTRIYPGQGLFVPPKAD